VSSGELTKGSLAVTDSKSTPSPQRDNSNNNNKIHYLPINSVDFPFNSAGEELLSILENIFASALIFMSETN
jgi:hypothetical protein